MIADELIGVARLLATGSQGRPRQVYLRRAVSSAYYALFHGLAQCCADQLVGSGKSGTEAWRRTYRALDHGFGKGALIEASARLDNQDLDLFAGAFAFLQSARHEADYDPLKRYSPIEALSLIDQAQDALGALRKLPPAVRLELATSVLLRSRR